MPTLATKAVVIAVGSAVVVDDGRDIVEEGAEVVDAAAHAEAVGPTIVAFAAAGAIVGDLRSADGHGAGPTWRPPPRPLPPWLPPSPSPPKARLGRMALSRREAVPLAILRPPPRWRFHEEGHE